MGFLDTILKIAFPEKCLVCARPGEELCLSCLSAFPPAERKSAEWIFPLYDYRHPPVKKTLWLLKYKGKKRLARILATALYGKIAEELGDIYLLENFRRPLLVPIPLSPRGMHERGFNQSELLCREISALNTDGSEKPGYFFEFRTDVLIKRKDTEHQARIRDRRARLRNILGSFTAINQDLLKDRHVILVDDILTTGATLTEARKALKGAGARKVIAFTLAH